MTDLIPQTVQPTFTRGRRESYSTTDESVQIRHPDESQRPHSPTVQGMRFKRTLKQFSLEGKITVVTGGARGLGLIMSQAIITSGSDLAIVDLNSMLHLSREKERKRERKSIECADFCRG